MRDGLGSVAFWGSGRNSLNLSRVQRVKLPATVQAGCIPSNWSQHVFWIPETASVSVLSEAEAEGANSGERNGQNRKADQKPRSAVNSDPYSVLGVSQGATETEIRAAYLSCIKQYHPDQVAHLGAELRELANRKAQEINRAYQILTRRRT